MQPSTLFSPNAPRENAVLLAGAIQRYVRLPGHGMYDYQVGASRALARQLTQAVGEPLTFNRPPENPDHEITKQMDGGLICLAPGMGKTYVIGSLIKASNPSPESPIVISTPFKFLNKQMLNELVNTVGIPNEDIGVYDSNSNAFEKKRAVKNCRVIITSCKSVSKVLGALHKEGKFAPLIIPDEVDYWSIGPQASKLLNDQRPRSIIIGFTATEGGACSVLFGDQAPLYHKTYHESLVEDHLCHGVRTHVTDITIDDEWAKRLQKLEKTNELPGEYSKTIQEKFSKSDAALNAALYNHFTHVDPDMGPIYKQRSFFFVRGVDAAEKGVAEFNALAKTLGVENTAKAAYITHKTDKNEAKQILQDFKDGKITALFSDRILSRGVDVKDGVVVHNLRLTKKKSVSVQQLGRVTRKPNEEFAEAHNGKIAVAFNYRLEGTNPVLFGELLEGKPEVYAARYNPEEAPKREYEKPPAIPQELYDEVHRTAKFYTKTHEVAELISNARTLRDGLSGKLPGLLNKFEYAKALGVGMENSAFLEIWNGIQRRYRESPSAGIAIDNQTLECGFYHIKKRGKEFCIADKHIHLIAAELEAKMDNYKPMVYFFDMLHGPKVEEAIRGRWAQLAEEYKKGDEAPDTLSEREVHIDGKPYYAHLPFQGKLPDDLKLDMKAGNALMAELASTLSNAGEFDIQGIELDRCLPRDKFAAQLKMKPDNLYFGYMWNKLHATLQKHPKDGMAAFLQGSMVYCRMDKEKDPPEMLAIAVEPDALSKEWRKPHHKWVSLYDVFEQSSGHPAIYNRDCAIIFNQLLTEYSDRMIEAGKEDVLIAVENIQTQKAGYPLNADLIVEVAINGKLYPVYRYDGNVCIPGELAKKLPLENIQPSKRSDLANLFTIQNQAALRELMVEIGRLYSAECDKDKPSYDCALPVTVDGKTFLAIEARLHRDGYADEVYIDTSDTVKIAQLLHGRQIISAEEYARHTNKDMLGKGAFANALGIPHDDPYFGFIWKKLGLMAKKPSGQFMWEGRPVDYILNTKKNPPELFLDSRGERRMKADIESAEHQFVGLRDVIKQHTGYGHIYDKDFAQFYEAMFIEYSKQMKAAGNGHLEREADETTGPPRSEFFVDMHIGNHDFVCYRNKGDFYIQNKMADKLPIQKINLMSMQQVAKAFGIRVTKELDDLFGTLQARYDRASNKPTKISGGSEAILSDCTYPISIAGESLQVIWAKLDPKQDTPVYIDGSDMGKVARILASKKIISAEKAAEFQSGSQQEGEGFAAQVRRRGRPKKADISPDGVKSQKGDMERK